MSKPISLLALALLIAPHLNAADAVFSSAAIGAGNNDANVGLLSTKTYFNAVNIEGGALTINGVNFAASSGGNPTGTGYTITGVPSTVGSGATNNVTGQLGSLVDNFIYNGNPGVFTLTGLTAGQTYSLTYYNRVWGGPRTQNITTTSGATTSFNQDFNGTGDLNLLRYTFTAGGTSEALNFAHVGASMHFYGFSTEQVFNNTWTSGAVWTTAAWSVAAPNAVGANADFTAQGAPMAINLDASRTVGHVRFAGANAWTVSGGNTLTLQADVGGVSVLGATSGTHTISTAMTLNSDVLKTGAGTVVLSGAITDNGKNVTLGAGTLEIANAAAQTMSGIFSGGGNLTKGGAGTLTLTGNMTHNGATTINAGTLEFAPTGAVTYANAIGGAGAFAKGGAATLTLTGTNTYTGATTVNAGTLKLQTGGAPLLTDNFTATGNPNTADLNFNLANRQTGSAALQNWTPTGNTQVGNPTNVQQPSGTNGDYLLLAFGAEAKLAGLSLSSGNVPGPLKINFDMFKGNTGDPTAWTSFRLSPSGSGFPVAGSGEFGFLYRNNTGVQIFNNGGAIQTINSTSGGDSFGFYLADSAGTGSPFAGNGTRVIVTQGGSILGSYALNTSMASSLIAFGSIGNMIGGVDNLGVNNFKTNALDPATAVSLTASGATLELDGVIQTVASLSGVSGSAVNLGPFSRLMVNGTASTSFDGVISGTFGALTKAGSGTLTLSGINTFTGMTTVSGGTLLATKAGALPGYNAASRVSVASGATLVVRAGGAGEWSSSEIDSVLGATTAAFASGSNLGIDVTTGNSFSYANNIGATQAAKGLVKSGDGTLTLSGTNTHTGGATVNGGTLAFGTVPGAGAGNIRGTLNINPNTTVSAGASWNLGYASGVSVDTINIDHGSLLFSAAAFNGGTAASTITLTGGTIAGNGGGNTFDWYYGNTTAPSLITMASPDRSTISANLNIRLNNAANNLTVNVGSGTTSDGIDLLVSGNIISTGGGDALGGITKTGAGTMVLSGANTYTGATTISAGTLALSGGSAIVDTGAVTISNAAGARLLLNASERVGSLAGGDGTGGEVQLGANTLTVGDATSTTFAGITSGSGGISKVGAGTLTLSGANTYSGITTLAGGVLNVASLSDYGVNGSLGNRAADTGGENMGLRFQGGALQYTGSTAQSTNRAIRISTVGGGGTINASGSTPAATVSFTATSSPNLWENGGTRTLTLTGSNIGDNIFAMAITDLVGVTTINLTKEGAGKWVLSGNNSYQGGTTINAGTLALSGGAAVVDTGAVTIANAAGARLLLNASERVGSLAGGGVTGGEVQLGANTLTVGDATSMTFAGTISGSGGISKVGAGTLTLTAANTYTGVTTLAGGVLNVASFSDYGVAGGLGNRASDSGPGNVGLLFRGGTLQYTGSTAQSTNRAIRINANGGGGNAGGATIDASGSNPAATLSFTATSSPDFFEFPGTRTLTLTGSNSGANTFGMAIGEAGGATSLTKDGPGKWVLSGANTYTGSTSIAGGTLLLGSNTALPGAAALNLGGGTLNTDGFSTSTGALSLTGASTLDLGAPGGTSVVSFTSVDTWTGMLSVWNYTGAAWTSGGDKLTFASTAGIDLAKVTFFSDDGFTQLGTGGGGLIAYGGGGFELVPVPEPSTVLGVALLLGVVGFRERRHFCRLR